MMELHTCKMDLKSNEIDVSKLSNTHQLTQTHTNTKKMEEEEGKKMNRRTLFIDKLYEKQQQKKKN